MYMTFYLFPACVYSTHVLIAWLLPLFAQTVHFFWDMQRKIINQRTLKTRCWTSLKCPCSSSMHAFLGFLKKTNWYLNFFLVVFTLLRKKWSCSFTCVTFFMIQKKACFLHGSAIRVQTRIRARTTPVHMFLNCGVNDVHAVYFYIKRFLLKYSHFFLFFVFVFVEVVNEPSGWEEPIAESLSHHRVNQSQINWRVFVVKNETKRQKTLWIKF